ncbi:hypothetical protein [Microlunatus speluncae]|nr:hypothetical protein [Microlunatus speluncae]
MLPDLAGQLMVLIAEPAKESTVMEVEERDREPLVGPVLGSAQR